jgi:hypothetical protein
VPVDLQVWHLPCESRRGASPASPAARHPSALSLDGNATWLLPAVTPGRPEPCGGSAIDCVRRPCPGEGASTSRTATRPRSWGECYPRRAAYNKVGSLLAPQHKPGAQVDNGYPMAVTPTAEPQHGLNPIVLFWLGVVYERPISARAARLTPVSHASTSNAHAGSANDGAWMTPRGRRSSTPEPSPQNGPS